MLHLLQMGPFKVLTTLLDLELFADLTPGAVFPASLEIPHLTTLCLPLRTPPACIPELFDLAPSDNVALPSTLTFKPLTFLPPTSYLLPLNPHHSLMFLSVFPYLLVPLSSALTRSGFFNTMLEVSESGAQNYYTLSRLVLLPLSVSRNPTLTHLPFPNPSFSALRSDLTYSRSGIFSPDATHANGGVIIFVR